MKSFNVVNNVGKARYVVNHHDGQKTHRDGSPFFDITICHNKSMLSAIVKELKRQGYTEK